MAAITHRLRCEVLEGRRLMASDLADTLQVNIDSSNTDGVRAAEIVLKYDPAVLDIDDSDITPGDIWQGTASLFSHIDQSAGQVKLFIFSTKELNSEQGDLVELQFDVLDQLASDISTVSLSNLRLNEGAIPADGNLKFSSQISPAEVAAIKACGPWQSPPMNSLVQAAPMIEQKNLLYKDGLFTPLASHH